MSSSSHVFEVHWTTPDGLTVTTAQGTFEAGGVTITQTMGWRAGNVSALVRARGSEDSAFFDTVDDHWPDSHPRWLWPLCVLTYAHICDLPMPEVPQGFAISGGAARGAVA